MKIFTEKVVVKGVNCRKITGFEGFKPASQLPTEYIASRPSVHAYGCTILREFDGERIRLGGYSTRRDDPYSGISFIKWVEKAKENLNSVWSGIERGSELEFDTEKVLVKGVILNSLVEHRSIKEQMEQRITLCS